MYVQFASSQQRFLADFISRLTMTLSIGMMLGIKKLQMTKRTDGSTKRRKAKLRSQRTKTRMT